MWSRSLLEYCLLRTPRALHTIFATALTVKVKLSNCEFVFRAFRTVESGF